MQNTILKIMAVCAILVPLSAKAQTISYADAVKALEAVCGSDIEKHCRKANLGTDEFRSCLETKTSATCQASVVQVYLSLKKRASAQASVGKICDRDAQRLCKGVKEGHARILRCLLKAEKSAGKKCNQAITDAGYR